MDSSKLGFSWQMKYIFAFDVCKAIFLFSFIHLPISMLYVNDTNVIAIFRICSNKISDRRGTFDLFVHVATYIQCMLIRHNIFDVFCMWRCPLGVRWSVSVSSRLLLKSNGLKPFWGLRQNGYLIFYNPLPFSSIEVTKKRLEKWKCYR